MRDPQVVVRGKGAEGRVATLAGLERLGIALEEGVEEGLADPSGRLDALLDL